MAAGLKVGDILNSRYPIEGILGEGGMGAVYRASDLSSKRHWAIKEMTNNFDNAQEETEALEGFRAEADILCELDHPNLPRITHCFSEKGRHYIVMDLVQGDTVEKMIKSKGHLGLEEVTKITEQLIQVLDYLHSHVPPIIFRDLKPANIMMTAQGQIKLIDFGIARFFTKGKAADTRALGTPGYAAPEQYGKGQSDARTDIYAMAATLHHCLTGVDPSNKPFSFQPPSQLQGMLPQKLDEVLLKALQLDPNKRWSNVKEFGDAFATACSSSVVNSVPSTSSAPVVDHTPTVDRSSYAVSSPFSSQISSNRYMNYNHIDFGELSADQIYKTSVTLCGKVEGVLTTDRDWISCEPSKVNGSDVNVDVYVDACQLKDKGSYDGHVRFNGDELTISIRSIPPTFSCTAILLYSLIFASSFVPFLGFLSSFILFICGLCTNRVLKGTVLVLAAISLVISLASSGFWYFLVSAFSSH